MYGHRLEAGLERATDIHGSEGQGPMVPMTSFGLKPSSIGGPAQELWRQRERVLYIVCYTVLTIKARRDPDLPQHSSPLPDSNAVIALAIDASALL